MEKVKVGQTSLLGYLPAILIKKILEQKQSEKRNPPINMPIKTVSLFIQINLQIINITMPYKNNFIKLFNISILAKIINTKV